MPHEARPRIVTLVLGAAVTVVCLGWVVVRFLVPADMLDDMRRGLGVQRAQPERHLIPDGHVGWVTSSYRVDGAPELVTEHGSLVFRYQPDGHLETASAPNFGVRRREYLYSDGDGRRPLPEGVRAWGDFTGRILRDDHDDLAESVVSGFFVGTLKQYRQAGRHDAFPPLPEFPPMSAATAP